MSLSRPSPRLRAIQYGVVAQISVICMINYMDRTTLAIANPAIRGEMGLSLSQMGLLLSAFPLTYALAVRANLGRHRGATSVALHPMLTTGAAAALSGHSAGGACASAGPSIANRAAGVGGMLAPVRWWHSAH